MPAMPLDVPAIIQDQAQQSGVDPDLAMAIILRGERSGANAVSPRGAIGYGQLMPKTAAGLGVDPRDPEQNLRGSVRYMRQVQDELGTTDPSLIAAGYNAGPGAVKKAGGIPNFPETQAYVQRVNAGLPQKAPFDDSDFDTKSGASQGINSSAVAPRGAAAPVFADSDFESAPAKQATNPVQPERDNSLGGQLKRQAGLTGRDILAGLSHLAGVVGDPLNYVTNKITGSNLPMVSGQGDVAADKLGLPTPDPGLESHVNSAAQGLVGAMGMGGGAAGLTESLTNPTARAVASQAASNLGGQAAGAITGSGAASLAHAGGQALGLNPYAQATLDTTAGLAGGVLGGGLAGRIPQLGGVVPENVQTTLDAAKSANVPVQLSDVNPSWASAMRLAGKLPFGTGTLASNGVASQQVAGVRSALENAAEQYRPSGLDKTAGAQGTDRFLANDLRNVAEQRQAINNSNYKAIDSIAAASKLPPAETPELSAAAEELWNKYPDALRNLEIDAKSRGFLNALRPQEAQEAAPQTVNVGGKEMNWDDLNPTMQANLKAAGFAPEAPAEAKPLTFENLNDLRTALGDVLGQAKQAAISGNQSRTKVGILSQMYRGITNDIDNYLGRPDVPEELQQAASKAQDYFKQNILPMRDDARINQVLAHTPGSDGLDTAAEGLHNYLFSANKGETSQKYLGMLSPEGQQATAYQAIKNATDAALNTATESGLKSATGIGKLQSTPALDNIVEANPGMGKDIARIQALMRLGRVAATNEASKGVLTGFQAKDIGTIYGLSKLQEQLAHHGLSGGAAYATAFGGPIAAGNIVSALNSRLPLSLRNYLLTDPGLSRVNALQGGLASRIGGQ